MSLTPQPIPPQSVPQAAARAGRGRGQGGRPWIPKEDIPSCPCEMAKEPPRSWACLALATLTLLEAASPPPLAHPPLPLLPLSPGPPPPPPDPGSQKALERPLSLRQEGVLKSQEGKTVKLNPPRPSPRGRGWRLARTDITWELPKPQLQHASWGDALLLFKIIIIIKKNISRLVFLNVLFIVGPGVWVCWCPPSSFSSRPDFHTTQCSLSSIPANSWEFGVEPPARVWPTPSDDLLST